VGVVRLIAGMEETKAPITGPEGIQSATQTNGLAHIPRDMQISGGQSA